jgi:hypothetical protein
MILNRELSGFCRSAVEITAFYRGVCVAQHYKSSLPHLVVTTKQQPLHRLEKQGKNSRWVNEAVTAFPVFFSDMAVN